MVQAGTDVIGGLHSVGAGKLVDRHDSGGLAVEATVDVVGLGAELNAGDILQVQNGAIRVGAQNNVAEVLGADEAALGADGVGEFLSVGNGLAADLASGVDGVLGLQGLGDLRDGDAELGELVGLDPHAQRVLTGAEDLHARDALDSGDLIDQVDVGVVGEEDAVVGGVGRGDGKQHQRGAERLLDRQARDRDLRW